MAPKDIDPVDQYSTLMTLLRLRRPLPPLGAAVALLLGLWPALETGWWYWLALGTVLAVVVFVALRAGLELLDLVTDLLVPR